MQRCSSLSKGKPSYRIEKHRPASDRRVDSYRPADDRRGDLSGLSPLQKTIAKSWEYQNLLDEQKSRVQANSRTFSSVHTDNRLSGGTTRSKPRDYKPGDVIRYPHVEPALDPNADRASRQIGYTQETGPVVGKMRPAVVVQVEATHLRAIPIYSSGGRGLSAVPLEQRVTCIALRSSTDFDPLWKQFDITEYVVADSKSIKSGSYIDLVRHFPINYQYPIKIEYSLTKASAKRLVKLYEIMFLKTFYGDIWAAQAITALEVVEEMVAVDKSGADSDRSDTHSRKTCVDLDRSESRSSKARPTVHTLARRDH